VSLRTHRLIRQLHLWIGAWGAIAAILFGISGFMQNHRGMMKLPQGESTEISNVELEVPESARVSREAMLTWLRDVQHLDVVSQRPPPARGEGGAKRGAGGGTRGAEGGRASGRWMFNGGNARIVTQVEYNEGAPTATVRNSQNSALAILSRLHKGVGGGAAWILLTDSFAVAMVALGISGLILWARGRDARQMVFSIVGVAVVVLLVIGGSAIV
jgi:hypothetical protein